MTTTVGEYWTPAYMTAYKQFITAMGTKFDTNARVDSINMAGTSLIYDEPWITGGAVPEPRSTAPGSPRER